MPGRGAVSVPPFALEGVPVASCVKLLATVRIDGRAIADGKPGPVAQRLRLNFHQIAAISSA